MGGCEYDHRRGGRAANLAATEGRQSAGDRRVSLEQDRAVMRIIRLNRKVADDLLRARGRRDAAAENIAARIVADVRRRGDAALFYWTKKLDGAGLARSEEHTSELQSRLHLVCRLLLEKKKKKPH